jgi:TPR repeat protein
MTALAAAGLFWMAGCGRQSPDASAGQEASADKPGPAAKSGAVSNPSPAQRSGPAAFTQKQFQRNPALAPAGQTNAAAQCTPPVIRVQAPNVTPPKTTPNIQRPPNMVETAPAAMTEAEAAALKVEELKIKAANGDPTAQLLLGTKFATGTGGLPKDPEEAVRWISAAAEGGSPRAQTKLGLMYAQGQGLTKDPTQAVVWYQRAADQNYAVAQNNLGVMYAQGLGVPKDTTEAYKWLSLSGKRGYTNALMLRDSISKSMTADQVTEAERRFKEFVPVNSLGQPMPQ